jgi:hypothetical protein
MNIFMYHILNLLQGFEDPSEFLSKLCLIIIIIIIIIQLSVCITDGFNVEEREGHGLGLPKTSFYLFAYLPIILHSMTRQAGV